MAQYASEAILLARRLVRGRGGAACDVLAALKRAASVGTKLYKPTPHLAGVQSACQVLYEDAEVTMAIFEFQGPTMIPLHDHPGSVASVVLTGELQAVSFDLGSTGTDVGNAGTESVICRGNAIFGLGSAFLSTPTSGPLHAFRNASSGRTAVLDLLWPSYSPARECTYFEWINDTAGSSSVWCSVPGVVASLRRLPLEPPGWEPPATAPYLGEPL